MWSPKPRFISYLWHKRFNICAFYIFCMHRLSFACSPIDGERLEREKLRKICGNRASAEGEVCDRADKYNLWWALQHPVKLMRLIKRYHMTSNFFIGVLCLRLVLSIHIVIKVFIQMSRNYEEAEAFLPPEYYPDLFQIYPQSRHFALSFLFMRIFSLFNRLYFVLKLAENSLINATSYNKLNTSQLNFCQLALFELSLSDWLNLHRHNQQHQREISQDSKAKRQHLLSCYSIPSGLTQRELIHHMNVLHYDECFSQFNLSGRSHSKWHCAKPCPRVPYAYFCDTFVLSLFSFANLAIIFAQTIFLCYLELQLRLDDKPDSLLQLPLLFTRSSKHIIRLLELTFNNLDQILSYWDMGPLYHDTVALRLRTRTINEIVKFDLEELNSTLAPEHSSNKQSFALARNFTSVSKYEWAFRRDLSKSCSERHGLNQRFRDHMRLIRLIIFEFHDLKTNHSSYLNLLTVGCGASLCCLLSLLHSSTTDMDAVMKTFIAFFSIICFPPLAITLIGCALVERELKQLHLLLVKVMVNQNNTLELKTVKLIQKVSRQLEEKSDRSIMIFGLYAITLESTAPFFTYLATAVLFLNRFGS